MRRVLVSLLLMVMCVASVDAATITRPTKTFGGTTFINGVVPDASDFNGDADTIYADYNGNITDANIASAAAIAGSKISPSWTTSPIITASGACQAWIDSSQLADAKRWDICINSGTYTLVTKNDAGTIQNTWLSIARSTGSVTLNGHLLFTDASFDIGASGATRPRDLFLSRNAVVGGTINVTGNATLSGTGNNVGTITTGVWNGTAIGAQYGGTGLNTSSTTGVPSISSGTWSAAATLATTLGGTGVNTSKRFKAVINATRDLTAASGTQTIAHGVTGTPQAVLIFVTIESASTASLGWADGTTNFCIRNNAATTVWNIKTTSAAFMATTAGSDADNQAATITFDATNINLIWTKTGTPSGTAQINMLAFF